MNLQPTLENDRVRLSPLSLENFKLISEVASQPGLVQYSPGNIENPTGLQAYVNNALKARKRKQTIPFIIFDKKLKAFAGSTRYM
ncbi:MAG: N-acetyltransferase, partial [Eudoraea sp.]|nr:N-acetyltransferase [Eudoraea sp.]